MMPSWRLGFSTGEYAEVVIHATREAFIKKTKADDAGALFRPTKLRIKYPGGLVRGKKVGTLHFMEETLGSGVVSHELLHAVFWWAERQNQLGLIPDNDTPEVEEMLCLELGDLVAKFWTEFYRKEAR